MSLSVWVLSLHPFFLGFDFYSASLVDALGVSRLYFFFFFLRLCGCLRRGWKARGSWGRSSRWFNSTTWLREPERRNDVDGYKSTSGGKFSGQLLIVSAISRPLGFFPFFFFFFNVLFCTLVPGHCARPGNGRSNRNNRKRGAKLRKMDEDDLETAKWNREKRQLKKGNWGITNGRTKWKKV